MPSVPDRTRVPNLLCLENRCAWLSERRERRKREDCGTLPEQLHAFIRPKISFERQIRHFNSESTLLLSSLAIDLIRNCVRYFGPSVCTQQILGRLFPVRRRISKPFIIRKVAGEMWTFSEEERCWKGAIFQESTGKNCGILLIWRFLLFGKIFNKKSTDLFFTSRLETSFYNVQGILKRYPSVTVFVHLGAALLV